MWRHKVAKKALYQRNVNTWANENDTNKFATPMGSPTDVTDVKKMAVFVWKLSNHYKSAQ